MPDNAKSIGFILVILGLSIVPEFHKKLHRAREYFYEESENAREIYTGKTRAVYESLDAAYKVTPKLKQMVVKSGNVAPANFKLWPVVSIIADPIDLNDPHRGIFANPQKTGRLWERAAYFSYFENGERLFESYAGLRVHGGKSRGLKDRSLRLYFKKKYGEEQFLTDLDIGLAKEAPIKRLLLRRDTEYNFATDFSFEIIRKLGGMAQKYKHVAVFVNGEFYDFSQMLNHPHEDQAKYFFGHDNFVFNKLKGDNKSEDHLLYENAIYRIKYAPEPISFEDMDRRFDLENFTANILAIMYTGTTDWAQGTIIKDQGDPDSKWQIISWDFDRAFYPVPGKTHRGNLKNVWEMESFKIGMKQHDASLRSRLFNRLVKETPEYKSFVVAKVEELFEEVLTPEWVQTKLGEYERLAKDAGNPPEMVRSIEHIRSFVANRKPVFCRHMKKYVGEIAPTCEGLL